LLKINKTERVDVIIGTRPEAIKMAPLVTELRGRKNFSVRILATGQHSDMLLQALGFFSLAPDVNLGIMKQGQSLDYITSSVLCGVGEALDAVRPDVVLVHGDTTTTLAASVAAFYRGIPVGHVEAGLRSFDMRRPFPEEMNRVFADRISNWLFAPTETAAENLRREGPLRGRIYVTGNTVIDALHSTLEKKRPPGEPRMRALGDGEPFILMTAHRRESWGVPMESICSAVLEILRRHGNYRALVPMHKNPAVRDSMTRLLGGDERIKLCEPLDYPDFVWALGRCKIILSDSGGVQEEASALGKPILVLRDVTERPEAVERGTAILVGSDAGRIVAAAENLLSGEAEYAAMTERRMDNPFGDGHASRRIADILSGK
jgi:UDP-N-acetylglucosamine 2-epimerase (non-hydrolysing)